VRGIATPGFGTNLALAAFFDDFHKKLKIVEAKRAIPLNSC
jgi:hypothetical protein